MTFQTKIEIRSFAQKISHANKILMLGSCFSNNIGERLTAAKFNVCINPFGAIYNPASIASGINILLENKKIKAEDLAFYNGMWYNFAYHTSFSDSDKMLAAWKMNASKTLGAEFVKTSDFIIITLGTAYAYKNKQSGKIVANCHKLPATEFDKILLNVAEISNLLKTAIDNVCAVNKNANFVFTVSPIRHLSDGAHENQVSKARLLLAVDEICAEKKCCAYFPAYEIMMDELRDYRFYADDMLHPSKLAVDYIWQRFAEVAITSESLSIIDELKNITAAKAHRPLNPKTDEHQKFLKTFLEKTERLQAKYPMLDLSDEIKYFGTT